MPEYPILTLKRDKAAMIANRHPWIFSGALEKRPEGIDHGATVWVAVPGGEIVATGTLSTHGSIAVRIFAFGKATLDTDWFIAKIRDAHYRRELLGLPNEKTNGYRVVFGESDSIPGLVVDRYNDVIVMQISTAGLDMHRPTLVHALTTVFSPRVIVERSDMPSRLEEKLPLVSTVHVGELASDGVQFLEHGLTFQADPVNGQKTGFFLDQKDLRGLIRPMARNRSVLNLFSYTGSMSIAALAGGAVSAVNVDSSADALARCAELARLNELDLSRIKTIEQDVFQYLSPSITDRYGMVILDPPALIKAQRDVESGAKAYHFLNRAAMRLVDDDGLFITSSCSNFFTEMDMVEMLRRASIQNNMSLSILAAVRQSGDHPVSFYFPESIYLKSFVCQARRH